MNKTGPERPSQSQLEDALVTALTIAVTNLFQEYHDHQFYYFALVTTGDGVAPSLVAWSKEALDEAVQACRGDEVVRGELKWSYADSPFHCYGEEHFAEVRRLFALRGPPDASDQDAYDAEYACRTAAMEAAVSRLDRAGLFGTGTERTRIVVNVECVPPDHTNTERALRLNPPEALAEWLAEAAEPAR